VRGHFFNKPPNWLKFITPGLTWLLPNDDKIIYLTFDDGPVEKATPYVLDVLNDFKAKASFFVVGEMAEKNTALLQRMAASGHLIGNHTYKHLNGWKTPAQIYLKDVLKCQQFIDAIVPASSIKLFRPPYGRLTKTRMGILKKEYKIILCEKISGDFQPNLDFPRALRLLYETQTGDIVLFHDSIKCYQNLEILLPKFLAFFSERGYTFETLNMD